MRILSVKKDEYLYLTNKNSQKEICRVMLKNINQSQKKGEIVIFDQASEEVVKEFTVIGGKWVNILNEKMAINAVRFFSTSVEFAVATKNIYTVEHNIARKTRIKDTNMECFGNE